MPVVSGSPGLESVIERALQNKWSIIPLVGGPDPQRGKRPALRWRPYVRRRPEPEELRTWFGDGSVTAYGLVCGKVSGLIVLDIDDPALAEGFMRAFPDLSQTRVVRSGVRETPHFYWRVDFPAKSRAFSGADLKAEGSYVVGPGSIIAGLTWRLLDESAPREICKDELQQVLAFFEGEATQVDDPVQVGVLGQDYGALYAALIPRLAGRNNALFAVARYMRDAGCSQAQAVEVLADLHVQQAAVNSARRESRVARRAEALATIRSAFSRPPCFRKSRVREAVSCPNSVREALLWRSDGMAILRTLEGAYLRGLRPGQIVTERLLCQLLAGIVSRQSIRKALQASYDDGDSIFFPPEHPPAEAEIPDGMYRQKHAFLSDGQKRTKPARYYCLPAPAQLCQALGLHARGSDPLTLDDLCSPRLYRQALHRALLQRRPGAYSQALLARRLGLSKRSIRRYNREMPVKVQPTYCETPVIWSTLEQIPPAEDLDRYQKRSYGEFLLDETCKRWPLKREIAAMLLAKGYRVSRVRQGVNYYAYESLPVIKPEGLQPAHLEIEQPEQIQSPTPLPVIQRTESLLEADLRPFTMLTEVETGKPTAKAAKGRSKRRFRSALPDAQAEFTAQRLHLAVDDLSLPNARRLVETYGADIVAAALRKYRWLSRNRHFDNPAGYFVTLARVSWRSRHPATAAPRFHAEPSRKSRRDTYVAPQEDPLWQSETYQQWRSSFFASLDEYSGGTVEEIVF